MLYHNLTGDASLSNDQISKEIEERLRLIILLEDPSIIIDLRTNNGFQGSKFDIFWDELDGYFNEHNNTVVNEHQTDAILYIPYVISIQKLRERIITHLNTKYQGLPLPSNISIPSEEWIRLNFALSNAYITKAMQYTERFNVKYKMQSRLLQKSSENDHYCHMIFKYERIKYQDYAYFISADDKHKVPIGEDIPVFKGVHNKKTLAPAEGEITAADHNFTKLSLIPFITLFINIPNNISESFYDGKVYACFKDAIFQLSSALRHSTEFFNLMNRQYSTQSLLSILSLYTDAVRIALHNSWCNSAERIMSMINYGLQDVAIEREKMPEEFEDEFEALRTLKDIREKAKDNLCLKVELEKCIVTVQKLLRERTEHLVWKNEVFETENPASDLEINEMFENILRIDSTLTKDKTTKKQLQKNKPMVKFIKTHCQERAYSFQIKKCNQTSCEVCYRIRMPTDVFQNLHFLPDPIPLRFTSNSHLTEQQKQDLKLVLQTYTYTCGSPIFPDNHNLAQEIFVRVQISCDSPIELLYYSSKKVGNIPICYWYGTNSDFKIVSQNLQVNISII
ncbi:hypothetical protein GLOIN_2v1780201 [Rhizophagus irregularis DAOM 181602=DAOM 197198]|uniref:Uncharacterized protein n=1 Tax=Rhizophagus irregularis (strain DAOM 181602 / DAOM 197198 / MUCL 43194) TaxID=747089 RepID=A0A2P4PN35_RHIID|nr:hypothetical protein GLOIN_2v1780201 [Rhizophagus irregularis DAOM 181602=DAOM 197198]POG66790.1 hypothetical protein GLOIN_2v1780201 [Rhizophagus irregularis DAOM 181602=DAOM 197198]|eukprot:XP_025173656.1 hypothetical protein GLOIN_2v1780201 [Rhizophagus irregularis DAOM 181602=DAOM 197198]